MSVCYTPIVELRFRFRRAELGERPIDVPFFQNFIDLSHYHDERLRRCGNRAHGRGSQQNWGTPAEQHGKPAKQLKSGERGRNRTFNLLIKSQLLCQLSYAPSVG